MRTFLDFIDKIQSRPVNEAFNTKDVDKMLETVEKLLKRHIDGLVPLTGFVTNIVDGDKLGT